MSADPSPGPADLLYEAHVGVRQVVGPDKTVTLPAEADAVVMGVHGALARHVGAPDGHAEHASTLDYVTAAAIACMSGTFVRALKARGVVLAAESYAAEGHGEVRLRSQVPVLERIEVRHRVHVEPELDELVERVHETYRRGCAVSRSLAGAIEIESVLSLRD